MYILFVGLATLETHLEGSHLYFEIPWIFLAWLVLLSHSWFCAISLFQNAADRRCPAQVLISLIPARWFGELLKTYSCLHRGCHAQRVPWPAGLEGGPGLDKQLGQGPNSCLAGGCGQGQKNLEVYGTTHFGSSPTSYPPVSNVACWKIITQFISMIEGENSFMSCKKRHRHRSLSGPPRGNYI